MGRQREMAVLVTLGLLVLSFEITQGQKFRQLSGTAGQAVILSCGSSSDGCSWNKDGKALASEERSDQARFSVASCDLTIEPLLSGDEGKYDCNNGQSRHHLRVLVEAGVPYIEEGRQSMVHDVQEGRQAELHCVSQGGRPAAHGVVAAAVPFGSSTGLDPITQGLDASTQGYAPYAYGYLGHYYG